MSGSNKKQQQRATAKHNTTVNKLDKELDKIRGELAAVQSRLEKCKTNTSVEAKRNEKEWKEIDAQLEAIRAVTRRSGFGSTDPPSYARYGKIRDRVWFGKLLKRRLKY